MCQRARGYQEDQGTGFCGSHPDFNKSFDVHYVSEYHSLTLVILVNAFEFLLVALVKEIPSCYRTIVFVLFIQQIILFLTIIGNKYCFESSFIDHPITSATMLLYFNDTLWDRAGYLDNKNCDDTTQLWFYCQLNQTT